MLHPEKPLVDDPILNLFVLAGYTGFRDANVSAVDSLAAGLAWCISATNSQFQLLSDPNFVFQQDKLKVAQVIEAALSSMGCPYTFQPRQIENLDYTGVYPVVQWVVDGVLENKSKNKDEVTYLLHQIEDEEHSLQQLAKELNSAENSLKILRADLDEKNEKNITKLTAMRNLYEKTDNDGANNMAQRLMLMLESLKELAAKLRSLLVLRRQLDDVPSPSELIQYERRFSELYVQIQEKLRQTRKYYATYNTILEVKELVLKETSLMNSINSQFQDAITRPAGRMKLIESMEGIIKGTRQKLAKVESTFQNEKKFCDNLKEKYAASIAEQRRCSSILKEFQEECAKNEKLRSQVFS